MADDANFTVLLVSYLVSTPIGMSLMADVDKSGDDAI